MNMLLEQFKTIFDRPEKVKKLRNLILQLAVRGKLVEQDENDEPASVLLERIKEEKDKLIKEGKIKKSKPLPEISEDEKPYELPEGWEWVRLGCIYNIVRGSSPRPKGDPKYFTNERTKYHWVTIKDITNSCVNERLVSTIEYLTYEGSLKSRLVEHDEIIIAVSGSVGKSAIMGISGYIYDGLAALKHIINNKVLRDYIYIYLKCWKDNINNMSEGTSFPNINTDKLNRLLISLPPLNEQKRIVEKVDSLMAFCDELEKELQRKVKYSSLSLKSVFNSIDSCSSLEELEETLRFIIDNFKELTLGDDGVKELKNAIFELAVQGRLVPQNSKDEPASVLLEKIKEEKEKLIREGKIKKEKALPEISEDEKPYELPSGWEWVRIGEYCLINPRNSIDDNELVSFVPMKLIENGFNNKHTSETRLWREIKNGFTHFAENDVVVAKITPCFENRKSAIMKNLVNNIGAGTTELYVIRSIKNLILPEYILCICKTEEFIKGGIETYTGTAGQQRVKKDYITRFVIGVPPLNEQNRIVQKVDSLMTLCDELENKIEKSKKYSEKLMEALLKNEFM
ncbi:restriction endonuclease subunit S [Clostridium fermenticellae]|uniref:Restriction endonuclease subunit S n=1 Tax=Clostridium fermenticellae TaxID=2068654 RepID=A0A386H236_9CLOT|nr:restriction endonuclease subunit S [Clostridium fermenticellae]AYD39638.1 restriction endonuclease subunit S [Clostridium fermenticellae]